MNSLPIDDDLLLPSGRVHLSRAYCPLSEGLDISLRNCRSLLGRDLAKYSAMWLQL